MPQTLSRNRTEFADETKTFVAAGETAHIQFANAYIFLTVVAYVLRAMSVSSLSSTSSALFGATAAGQTNWLQDTMNNIKASETQGGLLGMLSNAGFARQQ